MELKVWVEGIQRIVCGVTERTTCQDVVYALAHATGKTGRFTLIERWRNNERLLAPHEHPLKVLLKWGEYSNDVHFILQRTALEASPSASKTSAGAVNNNNNNSNNNSNNNGSLTGVKSPKSVDPLHGFTPPSHAEWKKSTPTVGVVRPSMAAENGAVSPPPAANGGPYADRRRSASNGVDSAPANGRSSLSPGRHYGDADTPSPRAPPPYRNPPPAHRMATPPPSASPSAAVRPVHAPPPYREPPRPRGPSPSPYRASPAPSDPANAIGAKCKRNLGNDFDGGPAVRNGPPSPPADPQHAQLIQLVNRQREKLDSNQELLMRLERDVAALEEQLERRRQEQEYQLGLEASRCEMRCQEQEEEIAALTHLQVQYDALVREEHQLKGQLDQFKADLSGAETQLDAYKQTLRSLRDDISREEDDLASELESELARVRADLEATDDAERRLATDDQQVTHELNDSAETLRRLRDEIDRLTQEIKEANLQSLSIAPADDLKVLLEGSHKSGHGRRMLGSPRQLENAVPTNKNPHGVWV